MTIILHMTKLQLAVSHLNTQVTLQLSAEIKTAPVNYSSKLTLTIIIHKTISTHRVNVQWRGTECFQSSRETAGEISEIREVVSTQLGSHRPSLSPHRHNVLSSPSPLHCQAYDPSNTSPPAPQCNTDIIYSYSVVSINTRMT